MKTQRPLWRLTAFVLGHYKGAFLVVVVCIVVSSLTTLLSTLFTKSLMDDYIAPLLTQVVPQYGPLAHTLLTLAAVLVVGACCSYLYNRIMIHITQSSMQQLRQRLFDHMQELPIAYFDSHPHGEIMSTYTNDVDSLSEMMGRSLTHIFSSLITIVSVLISMVVLSVPLTVVSVVMAAVMFFVTKWLGARSRRYFKARQQSVAAVGSYIEEMVSGQKEVKVFCHEAEAITRFESINEELRTATYHANRIANIVMPVNGNLGQLGYVLLATIGALLLLSGHGDLTLGTIVAFLTLNKNFSQPISMLSQQINSIVQASAGAERVFALMDAPIEEDSGTVTLQQLSNGWCWQYADGRRVPVEGGVALRHVNFSYEPQKQVLFDMNLQAMPEQKIAFVGGTGAGKTTIMNLLTRFYEVQQGEITYDGIPITHIRKTALRRSLGMVLQETRLFTGTVMDNIRYGRLDATDEECMAVARMVGADSFIRRLAHGYQTVLDGSGGSLSQGERQLIAVARAAVANPPVLILDEATSSIDTRTEQIVQQGMDNMMRGRTTFVIAHRLSTVRNADCIVVLEHGRIVEMGTHEELLSLHGRYHTLYYGHNIT